MARCPAQPRGTAEDSTLPAEHVLEVSGLVRDLPGGLQLQPDPDLGRGGCWTNLDVTELAYLWAAALAGLAPRHPADTPCLTPLDLPLVNRDETRSRTLDPAQRPVGEGDRMNDESVWHR